VRIFVSVQGCIHCGEMGRPPAASRCHSGLVIPRNNRDLSYLSALDWGRCWPAVSPSSDTSRLGRKLVVPADQTEFPCAGCLGGGRVLPDVGLPFPVGFSDPQRPSC
jgi:hypothetical protein